MTMKRRIQWVGCATHGLPTGPDGTSRKCDRDYAKRLATAPDHANDPASLFATDETDQAEARNAKTVCIR